MTQRSAAPSRLATRAVSAAVRPFVNCRTDSHVAQIRRSSVQIVSVQISTSSHHHDQTATKSCRLFVMVVHRRNLHLHMQTASGRCCVRMDSASRLSRRASAAFELKREQTSAKNQLASSRTSPLQTQRAIPDMKTPTWQRTASVH